MGFATETFKLTTDGDGDATSTRTVPAGYLVAIDVDLDGLDATADTTISLTARPDGNDLTILTLTNSQAQGRYYVVEDRHGNTGSALTADPPGPVFVDGQMKVVIAQGGATKSAVINAIIEVP